MVSLKKVFCFVLLLLSLSCFSQSAVYQEGQELTTISLAISGKLTDLKKNSEIVTEQLKTLSENLKLSQAEAQKWKEQSTKLSTSLESINEELNNSYTIITQYEQKLKTRIKIISILIIFACIRLLGLLFAVYCYIKGIKLPRILDIIL